MAVPIHTVFPLSAKDKERFWRYVDKRGATDCWPWKASVRPNGYGQFGAQGKVYYPHRIAWFLANGPIPAGMLVLHTCDNPPCCSPFHLWVGDNGANLRDAARKGRMPTGNQHPTYLHPETVPRGAKHWSHRHPEKVIRGDTHYAHLYPERLPRGEHHKNAKLTEVQVREIRALSAAGLSYGKIASHYHVTSGNIHSIVHGKTWKHVPDLPEVARG